MIKELIEKNEVVNGHHVYGPSSWFRVHSCPASTYMQILYPERTQDQYAEAGTSLHQSAHDGTEQEDMRDQTLVDLCNEFLSQWMVTTEWHSEETLHAYREAFGIRRERVFGTPDKFAFLDEETAILIDWKMGGDPPVAEEGRYQLQLNAMMMFETYPKLKRVNSFMFAPRINPQTAIYEWVFDRKYLPNYWEEWETDVRRSKREQLEFNAGSWCSYCSAKRSCPMMGGAVQVIRSNEITAANGGEIYRAAMTLEKLAKEAKDAVKAWWKATGEVPEGMRVKERRGSRYIPDLTRLWNVLSEHGASRDALINITSVPIGKAEALFQEVSVPTKYRSKAEAKKDFDRLVGTQCGSGSTILELEK